MVNFAIQSYGHVRCFFSEKLPKDSAVMQAQARERLAGEGCRLVTAQQVHGDRVWPVTMPDTEQVADALVTDVRGLAVAVKTADCVPILLIGARAVAAVHAGWRGTAQRIVQRTIERLRDDYGCPPETLAAMIGPCVCGHCYQTGAEVPEALGAAAAPYIRESGGHFYPDLRRINALWLREMGVASIILSPDCTACAPERYWSHRVHGADRGLQLSGIWLARK